MVMRPCRCECTLWVNIMWCALNRASARLVRMHSLRGWQACMQECGLAASMF